MCISRTIFTPISITYIVYVVDVAFEVLADVINIVNYSFNAQLLKDEGAVNDFCFLFLYFFCGGGGGGLLHCSFSLSLGPNSTCLQVFS